jgi:hypothetical protein
MIMNTFHSSGTPIGKLVRIVRWNPIITSAATVVTHPPPLSSRTIGATSSTTVPVWASTAAGRPGRRSSGASRHRWALSRVERSTGLLAIMAATTNGKCRLSFDTAAPNQMITITNFAAVTSGRRQRTARRGRAARTPLHEQRGRSPGHVVR